MTTPSNEEQRASTKNEPALENRSRHVDDLKRCLAIYQHAFARRETARQMGAADFFEKPRDLEKILAAVGKTLKSSGVHNPAWGQPYHSFLHLTALVLKTRENHGLPMAISHCRGAHSAWISAVLNTYLKRASTAPCKTTGPSRPAGMSGASLLTVGDNRNVRLCATGKA
jgi:hypothetical protein